MQTPVSQDAERVSTRLDEYLGTLRGAPDAEQAAVGQGLNVAYALFLETFKSETAFRDAGHKAQHDFLLRLDGMVERLDAQTGAAWGFRIFWMYARLMMEADASLALRYAPDLERLGAKGKALG